MMGGEREAGDAYSPEPVPAGTLDARNALLRRRGSAALPGGLLLRVAVEEAPGSVRTDLALLRDGAPTGVAGRLADLLSFAARLEEIEGRAAPARMPEDVPFATACLLCEALLAPWLEALDARVGGRLELAPAPEPMDGEADGIARPLAMTLTVRPPGEDAAPALLKLLVRDAPPGARPEPSGSPAGTAPPGPLAAMAELLAALPPEKADPGWPIRVTFELARTRIALADLRSAEVGDVIVLDGRPAHARDLRVRLGEWVDGAEVAADRAIEAWAVFNDRAVTLTEAFTAAAGDEMSENDTDGTERDAALDEVAVTLVLEAGRRTMPLGELRGLGPGHTLTLDRRVVEGLDLMVGGRRVGRGRLVRVGDTLGVRLTQLFGGTAPEAASPAEPSPVAPAPAEPPPGGAEPSRAEPPVEAPPHGELRIHDTPDADT